MLVFLVILATISLISLAWGLCETECEPLSSLLSACSLPPISPVWATSASERRNISGLPLEWWRWIHEGDVGPLTRFVANISQAECFCTEARTETITCQHCIARQLFDDFEENEIYYDVTQRIRRDCEAFGYYGSNLSYPSTTRSSMPLETDVPYSDSGTGACDEACGVMRRQVFGCGLTPLDAEELPEPTYVPSEDDRDRRATLLLNRTAAECLCTLPVLRRSVWCDTCLGRDEDPGAEPQVNRRVDLYESECHDMGYWSDREWVLPVSWEEEEEEEEDNNDDSTATPTSEVSPPSSTSSTDDVDGAGSKVTGLIAVSILFTSLVIIF